MLSSSYYTIEPNNPFYKHRYLLRVPLSSLQIRMIIADILKSLFSIIGLQLDFSKQLFVLSSYNPLYYWEFENNLFVKGVRLPYIVITETQVQENYQPMFLGQLFGVGFNTPIYYSPEYTVPLNDAPNIYSNNNEAIDTIQVRNLKVSVHVTRIPLRITGYMYFETYDQLLDVQSSLTQLVVQNRMNFLQIPMSIVLPKTINFILQKDNNAQVLVHLHRDRILVKDANIVGQKNTWVIDTVAPTYYRLESVSDQSQLTVGQGQEQRFRLSFTLYVDTAVIKMYDIVTVLPVKGCLLSIDTSILLPDTVSNIETDTNIYTYKLHIDRDYTKDELVISIPESINIDNLLDVSVTLYKSVIESDKSISIAKDLNIDVDTDNRKITVKEFVPEQSYLKIRYVLV